MVGFFSPEEVKSITRPDGKSRTCATCGLYKNGVNVRLPPQGKFGKKILNIGIAPTIKSDQIGKIFDPSYEVLLKQIYSNNGIDLYEDCLNVNACMCLPLQDTGSVRMPDSSEIASCRKTLLEIIKEYKPKVIITLGLAGLEGVIGHLTTQNLENIHKWRGFTIPDLSTGAWICPVFDLCLVTKYQYKDKLEALTIFKSDIKKALSKLNEPFPRLSMEWLSFPTDDDDITESLKYFVHNKERRYIAFDYETTGLQPYYDGHSLACVSFVEENHGISVPIKTDTHKAWVKKILRSNHLLKIAQNMKYEIKWSKHILKQDINPLVFDTMLASHILDNRRGGIVNLKFQGYVNFGIMGYEEGVGQYIKSRDGNSHDFNRVYECPQDLLLKYCGQDSVITYKLAMKQMKELGINYL